jgi:hypothetical protein
LLHKAAPWLLLAAVMAVYVAADPVIPFGPIDDSYISFRYAQNLVDGHGLVYNLGERVESYSGVLWVLLLALGAKLGAAIPTAAKYFALFFHAATIALFMAYLRRVLSEPLRRPLPIFALAFLMLHPTETAYAESGLETSLAAFLLLAAVYGTTRAVEKENGVRCAALAGLAALLLGLTRPEGICAAAPLALWLWFGRKEHRGSRTLAFVLVTALPYAAFLLWRHSYFGHWLPNTFYAEFYGAGFGLVPKGLKYFLHYLNVTLFPYLLIIAIALAARFRARLPGWWIGVSAVALTYIAAVVLMGGDHSTLGRFLAPVTPLLLALLVHAARLARDAVNRANPIFATVHLRNLTWALVICAMPLFMLWSMMFRNEGLSFIGQVRLTKTWCAIGKYVGRHYPHDTTVALTSIGAIGYCSRLPILDLAGRVDSRSARPATDDSARPGRFDGAYVLDQRRPPLVFVVPDETPFPLPEWVVRLSATDHLSRDLLQHREFAAQYAYHRLKISGKYFHYWSRRDFEGPEINSGDFPLPGVHSPFPANEPLYGDTLVEKILGLGLQPGPKSEAPDNGEVW